MDELKKERDIMLVMRKVLTQIVKDTTPPSKAMRHPLSDATIQDIRQCLGLISARERELADKSGIPEERPRYVDDQSAPKVVPISSITKRGDKDS